MAGGDLVSQVGIGRGSNFSDIGAETTILMVASDLQEEAPIYWLRIKQAAERGAKLIVVNPRMTKIERYASQILRYPYGGEAALVLAMVNALSAKRPELPESLRGLARSAEVEAAAKAMAEAENAIILFGSEGTGLESSKALARACANLLIATNHVGRPNNGLIGVWERPTLKEHGIWVSASRFKERLSNLLSQSISRQQPGRGRSGDYGSVELGRFWWCRKLT
jgi:NADH-quinone oxidoreductase subunit G